VSHLQKEYETTADEKKKKDILKIISDVNESRHSEGLSKYGTFKCTYCEDAFNTIGKTANESY
jgi:hypothetical protein